MPVLSFGQPSWLLPVHQHTQLSAAELAERYLHWHFAGTASNEVEDVEKSWKELQHLTPKKSQAANSSPLSIAVFIARTRESSFWQPCPLHKMAGLSVKSMAIGAGLHHKGTGLPQYFIPVPWRQLASWPMRGWIKFEVPQLEKKPKNKGVRMPVRA